MVKEQFLQEITNFENMAKFRGYIDKQRIIRLLGKFNFESKKKLIKEIKKL